MKKETFDRSDIYIGKLYEPKNMSVNQYEKKYQKLSAEDKAKINKFGHTMCEKELIRYILFERDSNNLARDLIYKVNNRYPILELNSKSQEKCIYIVEGIVQIEKLLTYLNYKEFLTKHEIKKIYRQLIVSSKWLQENKELFGYIEIMPDIYINNENGEIPSIIYDYLFKYHFMISRKPTPEELLKKRT